MINVVVPWRPVSRIGPIKYVATFGKVVIYIPDTIMTDDYIDTLLQIPEYELL